MRWLRAPAPHSARYGSAGRAAVLAMILLGLRRCATEDFLKFLSEFCGGREPGL